MQKHVVARVVDIPPGSHGVVVVAGRPIGIFNLAGEFFGLLNRCPHQGGAGEAVVKGPYVADTVPVRVEEQYVVVEI